MLGKFIALLIYVFYAGLIYTFFVPDNPFLSSIDSLRTVYFVVHICFYILFTIVLLIIYGASDSTLNAMVKEHHKKDDSKKQKSIKACKDLVNGKLTVRKALSFLNRLFTLGMACLVIVGLGDTNLGILMLFGSFLYTVLISKLKDICRDFIKAVEGS